MEKKLLELCTKKIVTKTYQKGFRAEKVIKRKGNKYRLNHNARPKKSNLVSGNWSGEKLFIINQPAKSNMHQVKYF